MRDPRNWQKDLADKIKKSWPQNEQVNGRELTGKIHALCEVELGLYLLSQLAPGEPAKSLWVLLTGYIFPTLTASWSQEQLQMLGNARYLLSHLRSPYKWEGTLKTYRQLNERVRGYDVEEKLETPAAQRPVSICPERYEVYGKTLRSAIPHSQDSVRWGSEKTYLFPDDKNQISSVTIPKELVFPPPPRHSYAIKAKGDEVSVAWDELIATAKWMDERNGGEKDSSWEAIMRRVQLDIFEDNSDVLKPVIRLTLKGLTHLIGMVSSGKSKLMEVLAVWAAQKGLHVTLVVGDVIGALNLAEKFRKLEISVAPILGASSRERHTERLHRVVTAEKPLEPLTQKHPGFDWLSTECLLEVLRGESKDEPLPVTHRPCGKLYLQSKEDEQYTCPIYSQCQFHQAQLDLVSASIWIATPASLVYTWVPRQLSPEPPPDSKKASSGKKQKSAKDPKGIKIRFAEMVYRRSDLVIVDEADQVQMQLDSTFSPCQTLVSRGESAWLNKLRKHVDDLIDQRGREQLDDESVLRWNRAHRLVHLATDAIYNRILTNAEIRKWIDDAEYFTELVLFGQLAQELSEAPREEIEQHPGYQKLKELFDQYIYDPLGDKNDSLLADLALKALASENDEQLRRRLKAWIEKQREEIGKPATLTEKQLESAAFKLEFALLVAVLLHRLNQVWADWKQVEDRLNLDKADSTWFNRPPDDYSAVIPVAPMGNLLALQYVPPIDGSEGAGDLRFFRCMGVGRSLMLNFHQLFASDGIPGPHVLLLSGTSWAGKSPGCHIQVPVAGVLRSPDEEVDAIKNKSAFELLVFQDEDKSPIKVSGLTGNQRETALRKLLNKLTESGKLPGGKVGKSLLEKELDKLEVGRKRILLVVGSYREADLAYRYLENLSAWRGKSIPLISDDDELEDSQGLPRGLVYKLADKEAQILIAPLLSIERGHNILNDDKKAAIGAAYFLVRPHEHPKDISYAIYSINRWAIEHSQDLSWIEQPNPPSSLTIDKVGDLFRTAAFLRWRKLLQLPMMYRVMPKKEREAVTWNQLVAIWQVIGRLIRGGCPARVFFCDAAFAPNTASGEGQPDTAATSLLVGMEQVLRPYFEPNSQVQISPIEKKLVKALYEPFYEAIKKTKKLSKELR